MMDGKELREIVASAQIGSETAYRELVGRFGSGLLGYFYRGTGNRAEAEDLLQEVFLRLVKGLATYKEKERFEVWLYRMAQHLLIDYWRKRKAVNADGAWLAEESEVMPDSLARTAARETEDQLQRALAKLAPEQREVLLMRYFSGMSFEEISKMNGTPLGTALARAHRGLAKLRQMLAENAS
jgi:RNA polymerase sigma-70 factor, ECF subfamily